LGWSADLVFSEDDYNTVSWSAGNDEKIYEPGPDGASHTITGDDTGNMGAETFIYWDPATSKTALQTTTDISDIADDPRRLLVCKCKPGTSASHSPYIEPIYGYAVFNETAISVPELKDVQSDTGNLDVQSGADITVKSGGGITIEDGGDIILNVGATPAEIIYTGVATLHAKSGSSALFIYPSADNIKTLRIGRESDDRAWADALIESDKIWLLAYAASSSTFAELVLDGSGITSKGNLFPSSDDTDNCGKAAARWSDVRSVLINGADICFENGWRFREYGASDEDIHKEEGWLREHCPDGVQVMNPDGEIVAVFHKTGLYVHGPVRDLEELAA
jgi:hypothetical protein